MKKIFLLALVFATLVISIACNDNNNNPTKPITPGASVTPTKTSTSIVTPGSTPTITATLGAGAPYITEWAASSQPNGFYLDPVGNVLYAAEYDGDLPAMETFVLGTTDGKPIGEWDLIVLQGPVSIGLIGPQGVAITNDGKSSFVIMDNNASGGTSIYSSINNNPVSTISTSWGTKTLKSPQGLCTDGTYLYVTDTGNGYIDEFNPDELISLATIHRWKGNGTNNFVKPVAVACDASGNVFVGDRTSATASQVQEYSSGGIAFMGIWSTIASCQINGMVVDSSDNVYISDSGNNLVEEYSSTGTLLREWGDPHGPREFQPFKPGAIAYDSVHSEILVGDQTNDTIEVFGP